MNTSTSFTYPAKGVESYNGSGQKGYAGPRAGTQAKRLVSPPAVGQNTQVFSMYSVFQSFQSFTIPPDWDGWDVSIDKLECWYTKPLFGPNSVDVEVRLFDWGATVDTGDFIPGDNLAGYTLLAYGTVGTSLTELTITQEMRDLLEPLKDRPEMIRVVLAAKDQRENTPPTGIEYGTDFRVRLTASGANRFLYFPLLVQQHSVRFASDSYVWRVTQEHNVRFRYWTDAPRRKSNLVRVFNHNREMVGVLRATPTITTLLDGADRIEMTIPWRYGRLDGGTEERGWMVEQGWYLEYQGDWYVIDDFQARVHENQLPIVAQSAEYDELRNCLTNYAPSPFSMVGTPTEIMSALLGGRPEHDWYNGTFADLDDLGFPKGWTAETGEWQATRDSGLPVLEAHGCTEEGGSEAVSFGLNMMHGAEVKTRLDVWVEEGFTGTVEMVLDWTNTAGVVSSAIVETIEVEPGRWVTNESDEWAAVRNEQCKLRLRVANNHDCQRVRFRRVRFLQREDETGWRYFGTMDGRDPAVPYNDTLIKLYGEWHADHVEKHMWSETDGDIFARVFTGDSLTVRFGDGDAEARVDILIDGEVKVANMLVPGEYSIGDLARDWTHVIEVVVRGDKRVVIEGLELSGENVLAVTWSSATVYEALQELAKLTGGELAYNTAERIIYHDPRQGVDLTSAGMLWLREGVNLGAFERMTSRAIRNTVYYRGAGDPPFQLAVKLSSEDTDDEGKTSIERFGVRRFPFPNRETTDLSSAMREALEEAERQAFPEYSYTSEIPDDLAARLAPGDTCRVTHQALGGTEELRALEIVRPAESGSATVTWGKRSMLQNPFVYTERLNRRLERLERV